MKKIIILLIAFSQLVNLFSQVGINTFQPHASAMLHVNATDKGLLIPALRSVDRQNITNPADGLMVYDTDLKAIVTYNKDSASWMIDLFRAKINSSGQLTGNIVVSNTMLNGKKIGIGTTDPATTLHVKGTITADNYSNNLNGNGPVPARGIIMWSGSITDIPSGWALCDGTPPTPDLRNRFIVGAGSDAGVYAPGIDNIGTGVYKPGNKGGQDKHVLIESEISEHTHTINSGGEHNHSFEPDYLWASGLWNNNRPHFYNGNGASVSGGQHNHTMQKAGGNQAHETRPPYYALAYIMKLP